MKLLLDTHTALWFLVGDERLSDQAKESIVDETNVVLVSAAVVWEIAIKRSLGKLAVADEYLTLLLDSGFQALALSVEHAAAVEQLPWHHPDPFDRMLVAQAGIERATIVSRDAELAAYGVPVIW